MKNYDKKVKQTRIFLEDYLRLKGFAQRAGVSMSEALHKLITGQALKAPAAARHIQRPMSVTIAEASAPAYQVSPQSVITTNGSKAAAFRIKTKGVRYA